MLTANSLLGVIGGIIVCMLGLLISLVLGLQKDVKALKDCINTKRDNSTCDRLMDKQEKNLTTQFNLRLQRRGDEDGE